jgi:hypothetical protein
VVVEAAATMKGSTARSASLCLLIGAARWDAPDPVDVPKPSLGNGNWEQTLFGVPKVSNADAYGLDREVNTTMASLFLRMTN